MNASDDAGVAGGTAALPLFQEVQRFRQWFFYVPLLIATGVVWWLFAEQIILGHPRGSRPIPDSAAWILAILFGFGFPVFALVVRLITEVRPGLLWVRLIPFGSKRISTGEIERAQTREYSPLREFGGWGIRISRNGRAYNAYGNTGVQLVLTDGSRVLIGTQKPEELLDALRLAGADFD
ncbi:MAG: DUF6141 family protein [bacterium]